MEVFGIVECRLCHPLPRLVDKPYAVFDDDPRNAVGEIECRFELRRNHDSAGSVDVAIEPLPLILDIRVPNPDCGETIGKAEGFDEMRLDSESAVRVNEAPTSAELR